MTGIAGWTSAADVRSRARRRWDDGSLLRDYVLDLPCPALEVPLRGPAVSGIGASLAQVRQWQESLVSGGLGGRAYEIVSRDIGGRMIGRMSIPERAVLTTYPQYWRLLGVQSDIAALDAVIAQTSARNATLLAWVARRPLIAISLAGEWARILGALEWLATESGRGRYLREIGAVDVDTKFIERHQRVLGELLDALAGAVVRAPGRTFAARYGFREPERLVQLRLDPALAALPGKIDEVALPVRHAASLAVDPAHVLVVENQVTFLSVPIPQRGLVVWGHGFDALRLGSLPWFRDADRVSYWGDIDTHGFAILAGLRSRVPAVTSVLMDRSTLVTHQHRWVVEPKPTRADLGHLDPQEQRLYLDLVEGLFGQHIRLEQERIEWTHALPALREMLDRPAV